MLTIKYRDDRGSESIYPDIQHTSWHEGVLTAQFGEGPEKTVTFGPYNPGEGPLTAREPYFGNPIAYVMNGQGATVARYEFYPPQLAGAMQADPARLAA